jgi:hypothetical protein
MRRLSDNARRVRARNHIKMQSTTGAGIGPQWRMPAAGASLRRQRCEAHDPGRGGAVGTFQKKRLAMAYTTFRTRSFTGALAGLLAAWGGSAAAIDFDLFGTEVKVDNLITIGASFRTQDRDPSLIGKSTLYALHNPPGEGLCLERATDNGVNGPNPAVRNNAHNAGTYRDATAGTLVGITRVCSGSNPTGGNAANPAPANLAFVAAPGSYAPNGDNGNLNFDKGDIVHAVAKITSDISFSLMDFNVFIRPIFYFDANYTDDFLEQRPDTTIQSSTAPLPDAVEELVGTDLDLLDYNISHVFTIFDRDLSVKLGNQVLNWGESSLLLFNSLNSVNALDATKVRMPGADLKEFFQPQGMVLLGTDVIENVSVEGWYQYEWKPLRIDPVGTFFSQSDTLGAGGRGALLGFGKNPEDPENLYEAIDTCSGPNQCADPTAPLGSHSGRTIYRDFAEEARRKPSDTGQYGIALKSFLEDFNNGTELSFYFANYHSRFPIASLISSDATCINTAADLAPGGACGLAALGGTVAATVEPLPVDTARLIIEYPENIRLYGLSFNTTVGDYALSGEYAYRDNLPVQIHSTDLTFAALNPALPANDVAIIPGRRKGFPDFVSVYRGISGGYGANTYIRGYERMESGQANLTVLRLIGGDNPIGASQMTVLFEMGMNKTFNMPSLGELQFQGGGVDTHISPGADGTPGYLPAGSPAANPTDRQNPTAHTDLKGFGTSESYGYRLLNLNRWDSALFGANLETLTIVQHDVKGTTPGIGTNFVHGRKQIAFGVRFDYLSTYIGEVRYSWNTGGAKRDGLRDRDNVFVTLGYQF